jgi:hypothetical protein
MKWWKLKEEAAKMFKARILKEGPWHGGDANSMWMKMYDGLYQRLCTKEGEKDIYRMAKS